MCGWHERGMDHTSPTPSSLIPFAFADDEEPLRTGDEEMVLIRRVLPRTRATGTDPDVQRVMLITHDADHPLPYRAVVADVAGGDDPVALGFGFDSRAAAGGLGGLLDDLLGHVAVGEPQGGFGVWRVGEAEVFDRMRALRHARTGIVPARPPLAAASRRERLGEILTG